MWLWIAVIGMLTSLGFMIFMESTHFIVNLLFIGLFLTSSVGFGVLFYMELNELKIRVKQFISDYKRGGAMFPKERERIITSSFSLRRLAKEAGALKQFVRAQVVPSIFVGAGILGTFIGLVVALYGLNMTGDADALRTEISNMMADVHTAFYTSIAGIGLSLITSYLAKHTFAELEVELEELRQRSSLDDQARSPEQLLSIIAEESIRQRNVLGEVM